MTAEQSKKLNSNTINSLKSKDSELVIETINQLSVTGNSAYIPVLIELLHSSENLEIKKCITNLLAELKHSDAIPLMIEAIENKKYKNIRQNLVSACWENGLDYSNYLSLFIDLMIASDFMVAFEAHTVITNMTGKISVAAYEQESKKIKNALLNTDNDKKQLLMDILEFLPLLEEGIEPQHL